MLSPSSTAGRRPLRGTFTGKTANVTWPGTGDAPVQLQLRVQLRRKNENYGQPSAIILVTVIP